MALAALLTIGPGSAGYTIAAIVVWGAAFTALPVCLQSAVLRVAPRSPDTASALYVVAFQVGIGGGALIGSVLVDGGHLAALPLAGFVFAALGTMVLLASRKAFPRTIEASNDRGEKVTDRQIRRPAYEQGDAPTHASPALR